MSNENKSTDALCMMNELNIIVYYIHECFTLLLENTSLLKFIGNYIWDPSISSH